MTDTDPGTWLQPAPKRLAMLAETMRGWPYNEHEHDFYDALVACHAAGWLWERICKEAFRLLLIKDSAPGDLRILARGPQRGGGLPTREDTLAALAEFRASRAAGQAEASDDEPEGGRVA